MENQTKYEAMATAKAEALFEHSFMSNMKHKNLRGFKRDYRTLYSKVIIPTIADQSLALSLHMDAEANWERLMMELVGEDGTGSVRTAIEQLKLERSAYLSEVKQQRETIKELQEALRSARLFILRQGASTEAAEAYEKVNQALIKSRN